MKPNYVHLKEYGTDNIISQCCIFCNLYCNLYFMKNANLQKINNKFNTLSP